MAVNLSPIWGAGAQLLDNSGNVLSGGKIYTYLAGTTTPAVTYTSSNGATANSNPIILNSAGRVPYEIWLTDGIEYKFVLKDSNDTLIGTWDNLTGINSNFINYYGQQEIQTATAGQTVFTLTEMDYQPGTGNLSVFVDGVNQYGPGAQYAYIETDSDTVTFVSGLHVGASVKFTTTKLENVNVADASQISYTYPDSNAVAQSVEDRLAQYVSVKDFGAVGDGVTDDTAAIQNAHATGKPVFYPYGTYKYVGYFPECEGGIIGEGWSAQDILSASAQASRIVFYNCTNTSEGAIKIKNSGQRTANFRIENVSIEASSWDGTTGCLGYGVDVQNTVVMRNVNIYGFAKSNIYCVNATSPFESRFESVRSVYSGSHGCQLGTNANALTFINYQGKWNGAPSFGVAPTTTGTGCGFFIGSTLPDAPPEALTIMGGDCSYNAGYGWNFESLRYSHLFPGYAEYNFAGYVASPETRYEARIGNDLYFVNIVFQELRKPASGFPFYNQQTSQDYWITNRVYLGGQQIHPPRDYDAINNTTAYNHVDGWYGAFTNAPRKQTYLSRNDDFSAAVQWYSNVDPAINNTDKTTDATLSLVGTGAWSVGLGSSSRFIKLSENVVRLPDQYYQATGTGWSAGQVARGFGSAAPTTGTWAQGDIVYNSAPTAGGVIGWVCVTGGTPGTWKSFGSIAA